VQLPGDRVRGLVVQQQLRRGARGRGDDHDHDDHDHDHDHDDHDHDHDHDERDRGWRTMRARELRHVL
jgi:ABC-type Zn2+ transport system substrate-binding protein/surface adhesin